MRSTLMKPTKDIPLRHGMLAWNSMRDEGSGCTPGAVKVILHPDTHGQTNRHCLMNTVGACNWSNWSSATTDKDRMLHLMIEVWHIACRDAVPLENIHDALMVIPEYRASLSGETFFAI